MFALPGIFLLLIFDYLKPAEVFPILTRLPLLYLFTALAILGFLVDLRLGLTRLRATPQLGWTAAFYLWSLATVAIRAPDSMMRVVMIIIPISLYLIVGHGVQTFRSFQAVIAVIFVIGFFLAVLGVHQGFAPRGCHRMVYGHTEVLRVYDGRPCEKRVDCEGEDAEPGYDYACEHVGLLNTSSVGGRVRYRGTLADPNELALALGITLPFAFAAFDRRRGALTGLLLVTTCALIGMCAILTKSRGGQIVFIAVLGIYFLQRAGLKGLIAGLLLALPILLFGGRSGGDTQSSTTERLEAWSAGLDMIIAYPILGVGGGQFGNYHYITAHSAYILTGAELGLPGMFLFSAIIYLSTKIPYLGLRLRASPVATTWSLAMLAAFVGMIVGITFLSYAYKEVLWIYIGLSGALYQCIRRHEPTFRARLSRRELAAIAAVDVVLIVFTRLYVRSKGL